MRNRRRLSCCCVREGESNDALAVSKEAEESRKQNDVVWTGADHLHDAFGLESVEEWQTLVLRERRETHACNAGCTSVETGHVGSADSLVRGAQAADEDRVVLSGVSEISDARFEQVCDC